MFPSQFAAFSHCLQTVRYSIDKASDFILYLSLALLATFCNVLIAKATNEQNIIDSISLTFSPCQKNEVHQS